LRTGIRWQLPKSVAKSFKRAYLPAVPLDSFPFCTTVGWILQKNIKCINIPRRILTVVNEKRRLLRINLFNTSYGWGNHGKPGRERF
jgi:hypothetical protein